MAGDYHQGPHQARRAKSFDERELQQRGAIASCSSRGGNPPGAHIAARSSLFKTNSGDLAIQSLLKRLENIPEQERVQTNPVFESLMRAYNVLFYNANTKSEMGCRVLGVGSQSVGGATRANDILNRKQFDRKRPSRRTTFRGCSDTSHTAAEGLEAPRAYHSINRKLRPYARFGRLEQEQAASSAHRAAHGMVERTEYVFSFCV